MLLLSFSSSAWSATAFIWSQLDSPDINVYFSPDGESTIPLTSRGTNVLPVLDRQGDEVWASWIDKVPTGDRLNYARLTASGSILEKGSVPASSGKLYAPSIAIEPSGKRVWLVWAEHSDRTEELFASYLNISNVTSSRWAPAIQITANDKFSANLPRIDQTASGQIEISWMHTGPNLAQRARATVSTRLFGADPATASQLKVVATEYDNTNGGYPRIKYISGSTDNADYALSWKKLTRNRTALMGAAISDSGIITRIVDRR